jgi:hypothetical protein
LHIKFLNNQEKLFSYNSGDSKIVASIRYDIDNMAGYSIPYNYIAQGAVKVWVVSDNGDKFEFPDFTLTAIDPIKIEQTFINSMGSVRYSADEAGYPDTYYQKYTIDYHQYAHNILFHLE